VTTDPRWLVLGPGGAGKSTLAIELARRLDVPLIHLDREFWLPGWVKPDSEVWHRRVTELAAGDAWVMDGNYSGSLHLRLPRATGVLLLVPSRWRCLTGVVSRGMRSRAGARPDLPQGCDDGLPTLEFLHWIATYRRRALPRVRRHLAEHPGLEVHEFVSRSAAWEWLEERVPVSLPRGV